MNKNGLSLWNRIELKIYRIMGINQFRRIILWLEKTKHFRDKGINESYHPSNLDIISLERYAGFLIYNAFLHCVSLFLTAAYAVLSNAVEFRNMAFDLGMLALTLLNIYCILLQRTNYLKLKEHRYKYYKRFLNGTRLCREQTIQKIYALSPQMLQTDCKVLYRIREAFEGRADCILTLADAESLKRIGSCLEPAAARRSNLRNRKAVATGLLDQCHCALRPYTTLQMRVDWIQRKLGIPGRKMLDRPVIITGDAECETLYRELIPEDTAYNFCLVCFLLYEKFTDIIGKVEANEA